jgi:hypothetical protein
MNNKDCEGKVLEVGDRVEWLTRDGGNVDGVITKLGETKATVRHIECGITVNRQRFYESLFKF